MEFLFNFNIIFDYFCHLNVLLLLERFRILLVFLQMYKIRPRRTRPQALLMLCMLLSFIMLAINIIIYELTPQYTSYGSQHYQVTFPFIVLAINIIIYELTPQYTSYGSQHYQVTIPFIMQAINIIIYEQTPQYTSYGSQHGIETVHRQDSSPTRILKTVHRQN